eukprot:9759443-Ditylum_brightwellii.AAC.1
MQLQYMQLLAMNGKSTNHSPGLCNVDPQLPIKNITLGRQLGNHCNRNKHPDAQASTSGGKKNSKARATKHAIILEAMMG